MAQPKIFEKNAPFYTWTNFLLIGLIAFAYYFLGRLGQLLAVPPGYITPVWAPSGIALASVILLGNRILPAVFIGSFLNNFILATSDGFLFTGLITSMGIAMGATLQAFVGGYLIEKYTESKPLDTAVNVLTFIVIALASCLINSTLGLLSLSISQSINWKQTWWTWWIGDSAGVILFTPFILSWSKFQLKKLQFWRVLEALLIVFLVFVLIKLMIFYPYDLSYTLIPLVVWAGFRFYQRGVTAVNVFISFGILWMTVHNQSGITTKPLNQSILLLELFFGILSTMGLFLAATLDEKKRSANQLTNLNIELEKKIKDRTAVLLNQLEHIKQMHDHLITSDKLATLGTLTAGVAHEIKNPLNFISNFSELSLDITEEINRALDQIKDKIQTVHPDITEHISQLNLNLAKILEHAQRANNTVQKMLLHARENTGQFELTNINDLIQEYLKLSYHSRRQKNTSFNIKMTTDFDANIPEIQINKQDIARAILNIIENAFDSIEQKIQLEIPHYFPEITINTINQIDEIQVFIKDNGMGIKKEILTKIFNPFFSEKQARGGTGLGLSITQDIIVNEHHGQLNVETLDGEYAIFSFTLPKNLSLEA